MVALAQAQQPDDWQAQVRQRVSEHQFAEALAIVEHRLADAPQDLEARGWRARLLAWSGSWQEAETEYRRVLAAAPRDVDTLVGLAHVLSWQHRYEEALAFLDRAAEIDPRRADIPVAQGRSLRAIGRTREARQTFHRALAIDPTNAEALAGLTSLAEEPRYEFGLGTDIDTFSFTNAAQAVTASLRARIHPRWTANFAEIFQHRFGANETEFLSSVTWRFTRRDAFTAGGGVAHDEGVIPKSEASFEYGHGFRFESYRRIRGVELSYQQHWLWFESARVLALGPTVKVDLPRGWIWSLQGIAARSRFSGLPAEWRPSGVMRLGFPLHRRLSGNVSYSVGTENFALVDQIGRFSARTYGGGLRYSLNARQEISGYLLQQYRSQDRTQLSYGFGYGIRF
jgi:tetratricopeptide (TPR) repeat protein